MRAQVGDCLQVDWLQSHARPSCYHALQYHVVVRAGKEYRVGWGFDYCDKDPKIL